MTSENTDTQTSDENETIMSMQMTVRFAPAPASARPRETAAHVQAAIQILLLLKANFALLATNTGRAVEQRNVFKPRPGHSGVPIPCNTTVPLQHPLHPLYQYRTKLDHPHLVHYLEPGKPIISTAQPLQLQ